MGAKLDPEKAPKIFHVNWFRLDDDGKFMWPGFGDNMRVLNWILDRCEGKVGAKESAIGYLPESIDTTDLDIDPKVMEELLSIDKDVWMEEVESQKEFFAQFGDRLPKEIMEEHDKLEARLKNM